jgi:hypothetical protein
VTAGLLAAHHHVPGAEGVEVVAGLVEQLAFANREQTRREAIVDEPVLPETADRRKTPADDATAFANDVGLQRSARAMR